MRKITKILSIITVCVIIFSSFAFSASAAQAGSTIIMFSSNTVTPNQEMTVTVSFQSPNNIEMYGIEAKLKYDTSLLELVSTSSNASGNAGIVKIFDISMGNKITVTARFKALSVGSASFMVYDCVEGGGAVTFDGASAALKIENPAPAASGDANLKSLTVSSGTLSPAFSPNTTSYSVTVPNSVDKVTIGAVKNHDKASVSVSGGTSLSVGRNTRTVTVTAENGTTKKYTVVITRQAAEGTSVPDDTSSDTTSSNIEDIDPLKTYVNGSLMYVAEDFTGVAYPQFLQVSDYTFNGVLVPALKNSDGSLIVLYLLVEDKTSGAFYVLNDKNLDFNPLVVFSNNSEYIIHCDQTKFNGDTSFDTEKTFSFSTVTINGNDVPAYLYRDEKMADFAIVYAEKINGEVGFYQYDIKEGTIQRYVAPAATIPAVSEQSGMTSTDTMVVLACAALTILAVIAIIVITLVKRLRSIDDEDEDYTDDEPFDEVTDTDANTQQQETEENELSFDFIGNQNTNENQNEENE